MFNGFINKCIQYYQHILMSDFSNVNDFKHKHILFTENRLYLFMIALVS